MKLFAGLLAALVGMIGTTRHANDRLRERALRAAPSVPNRRFALAPAPRHPGYAKGCSYVEVSTARECARRVRQRERLEAKRALRVAA